MLIREDRHGVYIQSRWGKEDFPYRPGEFVGYTPVWNTGVNGLKAGDKPKTSHVDGAPFVKIWLEDGGFAYWGCYNRREGDFMANSKPNEEEK